ncbi:MAG TPA: hypothetical protein VKB34_11855 [Povalibacter sp.]|nr:hypothetical protein [Povalibacter sp.]
MPSDDDYRRRDTRDYLNRQQDRADFERLQRDRTSAVYDGIRTRDEAKVRSALDIPPASGGVVQPAPPRQVTAGEQFREHSGALLFCLEWTDAFPAELIEQWCDHIAALDIERPRASLRLLAALSESYDQARRRFKPHIMDVSRSMQFEEQVPRIGREIDWLIRILEHVLAYEAAHEADATARPTRR